MLESQHKLDRALKSVRLEDLSKSQKNALKHGGSNNQRSKSFLGTNLFEENSQKL